MQTTDIVSKFFISQYYTTLNSDYKSVVRFYASDCFISYSVDQQPKTSVGLDKLISILEECKLQECIVNLDNGRVSVVPTENGGMIILVSGQMSFADGKELNFSQVFMIVKMVGATGESYSVKYDILQMMEVPELLQEEIVEEIVEQVPQEAVAEEAITEPVIYEEVVPEEIAAVPEPESEPQPEPVETFIAAFSTESEVATAVEEVETIAEAVEAVVEAVVEPVVVETPVDAVAEPATIVESIVEPVIASAPVVVAPVAPTATPIRREERRPRGFNKPFAGTARRVNNAASTSRSAGVTSPMEKKKEEDDFVVVKSRFVKKSTSPAGSTLFVKFRDASINDEALLQVFKSEGTVLDVKVIDKNLMAFVDFAEADAAEKAVVKSKEQGFHVGNARLAVDVKKSKGSHVTRSRPAPKKE